MGLGVGLGLGFGLGMGFGFGLRFGWGSGSGLTWLVRLTLHSGADPLPLPEGCRLQPPLASSHAASHHMPW